MLSSAHKTTLLQLADASIKHQLLHQKPLSVLPEDFDAELQAVRASFVTLHINEALRGCIGMLEAIRPLVADVTHNASAAAFNDPRFPPVSQHEFKQLDIHISVLSPPEALSFSSEEDLLKQIRVDVDGLILEENYHRGTFLPSVWEQLPSPRDFLKHLKQKAGLDMNYWSDTLRIHRYTTESFGGEKNN